MDDFDDPVFIHPHSTLRKEYLKIALVEKDLLNFYYDSLNSFDKIFSNTEQSFGKFINVENNKQLTGRYIYIILQTKNALDSFFGHYFILKNGLCNASIPLLRFDYETLLKNYFYLTLPLGIKNLVKYHKIQQFEIRKTLYAPLTLENSHKKLYGRLSTKSHAGIISSSPAHDCSPEMYKDSLETGIWLLHGYFVFLLECFNQFISDEDRNKIKEFFVNFCNFFNGTNPTGNNFRNPETV